MQAALYAEFLGEPVNVITMATDHSVQNLIQQTTDACERATKYYAQHGYYVGANESWGDLIKVADELLDSYVQGSRHHWIVLLVKIIAEHMDRFQSGNLALAQYSLTYVCDLVTKAIALTPEGEFCPARTHDRPDTWVTERSGDIGYTTFAPNGLLRGCNVFSSRSM